MAQRVRRALASFALLALAACGGGLQPPDMQDPASVARAFVEAFKARSLKDMLPLVGSANLDAVKEALAGGPGSEAYNGIFVPDVIKAMEEAQGKVEGPRYERRDAVVKVAKAPNGDVHTIVLEKREDGSWLIEELATMTEEQFLELNEQPKR